jgi:hypothetical protein
MGMIGHPRECPQGARASPVPPLLKRWVDKIGF